MNHSLLSKRSRRWIAAFVPLLIAAVFLLIVRYGGMPAKPAAAAGSVAAEAPGVPAVPSAQGEARPGAAALAPEDGQALAGFRRWAGDFSALPAAAPERGRRLEEGLALARDRRSRMLRLIRENPEQAIAESLSFEDWAALPEEVRALVEKPFSVRANYNYYPVCTPPGTVRPPDAPDYIADLEMPDGAMLEAFVYGQRGAVMSKRGLAVQGIALNGLAAIRDGVFQQVPARSLDVVRQLFPGGQEDPGRSFATGQPVGPDAVTAVAGGRWYVFASESELQDFDARFAKLDAQPGPAAASSVLGAPLAKGETGAFDWEAVESFALEQASQWTETEKKLFLIRVNFPDNTAEPVTQAAADATMNGPASDSIRAQSYGKTWIEAGVSANLYTLPQTAAYYVNGGSNGLNTELLRDARNTFRNNRSGADAAIDIGPVSETGSGDGGGLGDYDIVGITFASIGMTSGTVLYAGLAGGGNLWMQGTNSTDVYVHEWGHNYGLGHASSWDTTDGSVVGAGTSAEYGDIFDIMGDGPVPEGHFHPQGKSRLNWLTSSQWTDASASGPDTYRIYRIDDANTTGTNSRGVRVTKGDGEYYWIGYRPAFDGNARLQSGAYLIWQRPAQTRCWLLDATPGTADGKKDAAIGLGQTYADTAAEVFVTPVATGGAGADRYLDVTVNLGPFPGNNAPKAGAISGPATVAARTHAVFSVSASDPDADTLAYAWDTHDGAGGANASSLIHAWTVGGTYTLSVTVSDMKGGTFTVNKTVTVTDPVDGWTEASAGSTEDLQDVVWGKGRFVAAEYWGTVYASWDGQNWTSVGAPPAFDKQPRLAFGNGVFVVAGKIDGAAAAQICHSSDGRTWREANFPAGVPQVREVTFANGRFVAVGDGGTVLRSVDGVQWSLTSVSGAPDFRHIAWDGTAWLALGMGSRSWPDVVWTSLDAVAWTQRSALGKDLHRAYGANGVFYLLGWYSGVGVSTDHGLTWQNASMPGTTRWTTNRMAIAEDGTMLVTGQAMDETNEPKVLLLSTDGCRWARSTENGGNPGAANAKGLAFGFGKFVAVDDGGVTRCSGGFYVPNAAPAPAFSANPATAAARQSVTFGASATDADGDALVYAWEFGAQYPILDGPAVGVAFPFGGSYTATLRVSDGRGGLSTLTHNVTVNDPARSFTLRDSGTAKDLHAIAANGSVAVAVGGNGGVIRTSTDGVTWSTRMVGEFASNITFRTATWDGSKFIIAGQDYNFTAPEGWQGTVYTSPDGISWTRGYGTTNRGDQLYAVVSDGTGAVVVGNSGTVLISDDGFTWGPVAISGIAPNLRGVAWNGSVYAVTGYTGTNGDATVFTSSDRTNWMNASSGASLASWQDLRKIAWLNDRFVASGWYSKLRTSTDGGQTFTTTRTNREENPAMAYGDGIYFTAGEDRDASNADVDVLSLDGSTWYSYAAPTMDNRNGAVFFKHTFITVGDGGTIWQSGDTTPASGFHSWLAAQFPGGGAAVLPGADPDRDGIPNLVEYALNRDPNAGTGSDGAASLGQAVAGDDRVWLQLNLPEPAMPDVTYAIQGVEELGGQWEVLARKTGTGAWTWLAGGTARLAEGAPQGDRIPVAVGMPDSAYGESRYFLRLEVEQQ